MKRTKIFGLLLASFITFGLLLSSSSDVSAISVNQTEHNYLWNTDTAGNQAYSLYEPGTRNVGTVLYTGAFKIGRVQFSFPVSMQNLASATTLNLSFRIEGTNGDYNGKNDIRLNSTGQYSIQSGACTANSPQYSPNLSSVYFDYSCNYNLKSQSSISELWFDIGNFAIESGTSGTAEGLFNSASNSGSLKFIYIEYNYQTNPSYGEQQNQTIINQNQTIIDQNSQMIQGQNNIWQQNQQTYEYLTDDTPPTADTSTLSGSSGWLPPGPVDSILTLPIQLAQGIVNVFTNPGTCSPLSLPLPWVDYNLEIPCVGPLMDETGFTPIWGIIGGVISAFIIYDTLKWLYRFVDDTLTLRENNSTMWGGL